MAVKETPACSSNLDLSASLLTFLSNALSSSCPFVQPYVQASLNQELVTGLANLILAASEEPLPSSLPAWPKFSLALSTFTTSMISAPLSSSLASALLEGLHLSPTSTKPWPLAASRRALSVLAQVLLTRQASEEAHSTSVTSQYVAIWQRAVDAMAAAARAPAPQEDVSVTTVHLLLLLFHSLQLMQKKTVNQLSQSHLYFLQNSAFCFLTFEKAHCSIFLLQIFFTFPFLVLLCRKIFSFSKYFSPFHLLSSSAEKIFSLSKYFPPLPFPFIFSNIFCSFAY